MKIWCNVDSTEFTAVLYLHDWQISLDYSVYENPLNREVLFIILAISIYIYCILYDCVIKQWNEGTYCIRRKLDNILLHSLAKIFFYNLTTCNAHYQSQSIWKWMNIIYHSFGVHIFHEVRTKEEDNMWKKMYYSPFINNPHKLENFFSEKK